MVNLLDGLGDEREIGFSRENNLKLYLHISLKIIKV